MEHARGHEKAVFSQFLLARIVCIHTQCAQDADITVHRNRRPCADMSGTWGIANIAGTRVSSGSGDSTGTGGAASTSFAPGTPAHGPITIVIPKDRQNEEREILTHIRRGEGIVHFETVRQRKHGSLIAVSTTVSPVKNAEGKIIGASKIARDITEQKRNQEQIVTLAHEAEHRSKNLLALVQAAVHLSQSDTPQGLKRAIEGRIQALANVHSLFAQSRWIGAELSTIAAQELAPYLQDSVSRARMEGPQVLLEPGTAQAIAVVLHELTTNAAKYGALSSVEGQVTPDWSQAVDGLLTLHWTEKGGPPVKAPTRHGFGGRIIERMIGDLKGKAHFDWRPEGIVCEIIIQA